MPYSPLVSKIRVHNPNKKGSSNANRNYVTYIATREGVSLETIRDVNNLLDAEGMMEKELREGLVHQEADNKNYVEYIARRPRSQGLFGNIATDDLKEVSSEIAKLTQQGRIIYRGIISLSERDAEELGFRDINAWNNYLRRVMPDIAEKLGVSSCNHTWVAAFHAEESHPHVHYMLWDNNDKVKSPYIHTATQQKIRILLEKEMFDNVYERAVKMAYKQEFDDLNKSRNLERTKILDETQELMKRVEYVPGIEYERLPSRASNDYLRKIADETKKLIMNLPGEGSFKYDYLPPDVKEQLNKVIDLVLEKKDIKASLDSYLQYVEEGQKLQGRTTTKIESEVSKAERDIRKRIGNKILKEIRGVVLEASPLENEMEREIEKQASIKSEVSYEGNNMYETFDAGMKSKYFLEWNDNYKKAMDLLYGDETDIQGAFDILENEAISGNALAIFEAGKMIDKELLETIELQEANEYFDEARDAFERIYSATDNDYKKQYAAYRLGKIYMSALGSISEADYKEAEKWLKRAPENKYAQYSLGKLYLTDKIYVSEREDTLENKEAALELFEQSAEGKNPFASYELGKMYSQGIGTDTDIAKAQDHYKGALARFLQMAEKGTDDALFYRLGKMYLDGLGTEVNEQEGEKYIYKAAKLGNEAAKLSLATIYLKKDDEDLKQKAIKSLKEMADGDSKHPMAQYKLGAIYADAEQSVYDIEKAISYLEKSSEQGNQFAQYKLGAIYADAEQSVYDMEKAVGYLEKSSEQGNQFAQYKLGAIYADAEQSVYDMEKAIGYLEKSAEQGNQFAQYKLGAIYADAEQSVYDMEKAIGYLEKSAEQGNQFAQYKLGAIYADAEQSVYDMEKAIGYLEKSAEQGNQFAQYKLGAIYADAEQSVYDMEKAVGYLEKSSEQGNQFAQYKLGAIYADGEQSIYDMKKAIGYLEKSAEQGNQFAQYKLGAIYADGEQSIYDMKKAIGYLEKSAEQGNQFAQYKLGAIYADGEQSVYDIEKAISYLEQSAEQGNQFAQYKLGAIYADGEQPVYDMEKAISYLEQSAEQDNQFAQYKLGAIYADKDQPEYYNMEKAISYLERSAESRETEVNGEKKIEPGNQYAQYLLGVIYANPENEEEGCYNLQKAIGYFEEAEKQGNQFAQYRLGCIYEDKTYMHYNMDTAIRYFTRAAHQGNQYAQCRLGCIYYFGKGVPRNEKLGKMWLQSAADQGNQFAKDVLENELVGINFSYCLLKGMLSSLETLNRQTSADVAQARTQSKQAMREEHLHYDREQGKNQELE